MRSKRKSPCCEGFPTLVRFCVPHLQALQGGDAAMTYLATWPESDRDEASQRAERQAIVRVAVVGWPIPFFFSRKASRDEGSVCSCFFSPLAKKCQSANGSRTPLLERCECPMDEQV